MRLWQYRSIVTRIPKFWKLLLAPKNYFQLKIHFGPILSPSPFYDLLWLHFDFYPSLEKVGTRCYKKNNNNNNCACTYASAGSFLPLSLSLLIVTIVTISLSGFSPYQLRLLHHHHKLFSYSYWSNFDQTLKVGFSDICPKLREATYTAAICKFRREDILENVTW